ncbi:acyl-[ACP]--phospholipid O-acyltransferase [Acidisoma sp. C75]
MIRWLLTQRRFAPLFWCQFFAAFNDNFLKNALLFLILWGKLGGGVGAGEPPHTANALITLAGAVFILPFFLLSALGGEMADRYDKARLAQGIKLVEMAVAILAVVGFLLQSIPLLFLALFAFGVLSALFGPVKYAILPDHLPREALTAANALVEGATFLAIIGGTAAGGLASTLPFGPLVLASAVLLCAVLSWLAARRIPKTGEAAPDLRIRRNILASTFGLVGELRGDRRIFWAALANAWFWLVGAIALGLMPGLIKQSLGGSRETATFALLLFCVGIAAGSLLTAQLIGRRVSLLPAVLGTALVGAFLCDLWLTTAGAHGRADLTRHVFLDLVLVSAAGGLLAVPSFAAIQAWARPDHRARAVAGANVVSAAGMAIGALGAAVLLGLGLGVPLIFGLLGLGSLAVAAAMLVTVPLRRLPDLLWLLLRLLHRVEIRGAEHLRPQAAGAIIAVAHTSWLDALVTLAILETPPVFVVERSFLRRPWMRFLRRFGQPFAETIWIGTDQPIMATRRLLRALREGRSLVIFPEGRLGIAGAHMKVDEAAALIAARSGAPVLALHLDGAEHSLLSRVPQHQVRRRLFPKLRITALAAEPLALPQGLSGRPLRAAAVAALHRRMIEAEWQAAPRDGTLFAAIATAAHRHGLSRTACEDPLSGKLTYRRLFTGAAVLGRAILPFTEAGEAVGVLMPSANATFALLLGLSSARRVPTLLNFTAGVANTLHACHAAQIRTILTSRAFIAKAGLEALIEGIEAAPPAERPRFVYLEDLRKEIGLTAKLRGLAQGTRPLLSGGGAGDRAAIVFTSGSEGRPKGVVISQGAMLANIAQVAAVIEYGRADRIFNVLPLFHSFGLTAGFLLPLAHGVPIFSYPSPLHYKTIPELVRKTGATVLFGTDTFLMGYARNAEPTDFRTLRFCVAGAEPVKSATQRLYTEKFGVRILEGYGVSETGPVLALNTPRANRFGSVGRLLPGIEARLEAVAGIAEGGRLSVRGPNIMLGYLMGEQPGAIHPPPEGWHDTGDIVRIDGDGFLSILGRAKRFAKLGGEMVSLAAIDRLAADLWPDALSVATHLPDLRKGERIVLLTESEAASRAAFILFARAQGASDLMIPAEIRRVASIPLLGSGKVDFAAAERLARATSLDESAA